MRSRKGFTLIELMVVVLIVAVLAAVLIPMISARVEAAKWSEGKAGAGTIATALRAYAAEHGSDKTAAEYAALTVSNLFKAGELDGKYFKLSSTPPAYSISNVTYTENANPALTYTITVVAPSGFKVTQVTLTHLGAWTETQS